MAQESLKVKIGADVAGGVAGVKQFGAEVNKLPASLNNFKKGSNEATQSLINLSRVAQDAPYGFIGIANNINPLLESFQRLKKESGSTGSALKALGGSLVGAGGLGLAVGIVTSLLTVFAMRHHESKEKVDEHKKAVDEAADKEKEYVQAVDAAAAATVRQANSFDDLKSILKTTTPEISKLTDATIKQGLAQFVFSGKNEAVQKLLNAQIQLEIQSRKTNNALAGVREVSAADFSKNPLIKQIGQAQSDIKQLNALGTGLDKVLGNIFDKQFGDKAKKAIKAPEIKARTIPMPVEPVLLGSPSKVAVEMGKNFEGHPVLLPVKPDLDKDALFADIAINLGAVRKAGSMFGEEMGSMFSDSFQARVQAAVASGLSTKDLEAFQEALKTTMVIGAQVADVLGNAFGAFGQALVNGQNALQAFFGSVKSALSQLIGQLLKTVAVAAILSAISGGAGAAGGFSFLGALKGLLGAAKPFAAGGLVSGPTLGLVGEGRTTSRSNPEVIAPLNQLKKFIGGGQQTQVFIPALHVGYDQWRISFNRANNNGRMFG
jgi:hypothetical protein